MDQLLRRARAWVQADPDPATRAELSALIEARATEELAERMDGSLTFGTAGIRGAVGAGSNRMNRAAVIRTTRGLADYLLERYGGPPPGPVVVGRDARLSSDCFMRDTMAVLAAAGLRVRYWAPPVPTPLVAYAVRALGACAGVMITASHNPPEDNGYKVYDAGGSQIIPPVDSAIAAAIDRVGPAIEVPRIDDHSSEARARVSPIGPQMLEEYRRTVASLRHWTDAHPGLRIVYTPLHGVGWPYVREVLAEAGHRDVHPVPEQEAPDGHFPTVRFPNPEEPGALDLSLSLARRVDADLVLANDPDADRLGVALPGPQGWVSLTGNQIGVLLADYVLAHWPGDIRPLIVTSIVSSPMVGSVADAYGARFETTLTGFKWIATAALDVEVSGEATFAFGYEEAIGYAVGGAVRDKDGVSAALMMADLVAECRRQGQSLLDRLADLYRRYGLWVSVQRSIRRPGSAGRAAMARAMLDLAEVPPGELGGIPVIRLVDYRKGAEDRPRWLGAASLIRLDLADGTRLLVRPSGTEPKLKIYVDARAPVPEGADLSTIEGDFSRRAESLATDLVGTLGIAT